MCQNLIKTWSNLVKTWSKMKPFCKNSAKMRFKIALILLIMALKAIQGQELQFPEILSDENEHVIHTNESWEISCSGTKPVFWTFSNETKDRTTEVFSSEEPFVSTLRLDNANYLDTGDFYCKYKDVREYFNLHNTFVRPTYMR